MAMISAEVKRLREAKEFQAAIQLGEQNLNDHATLIQVDWAYFGLIKQNITQFTSAQNPPFHLIKTITHNMWAYTKLPNRRANSSLSNIVRELGKIAPYLPEYLNFIDWVTNIDGWQKEDWQYSEFNGKYYAPIVCGVARNLAKWANQFQAIENDLTYILDWLRNTRMVAKGDDKLWLDWDSVKILKQLNRHTEATKILANVIKVKRNEFWVWQQAGQLYANEQPELARACFCRALSCGAKPEFSINVHSDLAQLLAQQGEYAWATAEILTVINIREQHGWRIPENLQKIMSQSWYDPSSTLPQTQPLYEQYSPEALVLCFDDVSEVAANFVTVFEIQDKGKKLAKFVYKNKQGQHISIVSKDWKSVKNYQSGKPVTLLIGMTENQQTQIMHISPRQSDTSWDCAKVVTDVLETVHHHAPVQLAQWAVAMGVKHWVQLSALGADAAHEVAFVGSKGRGDKALSELGNLTVNVARPSVVFGRGGASCELFLKLVKLPLIALPDGGQFAWQPVHVDDVAAGLVAMVETPLSHGQIVNMVGGSRHAVADYFRILRQKFHGKQNLIVLPIPMGLIAPTLPLMNVLSNGFLSSGSMKLLQAGSCADKRDFVALLQREPLAVAEFHY